MKKMNEIGDTAKGQKALKSYSDKAFKSQDKAEAEYDHDHFDSGHHNQKAADTIKKREIGRERAAQRMKKEDYVVKHLDSYKDGQQAAKDGKKYSDNPHPKNSKAHLNWSKGHNTHRANKMNEAQNPEAAAKASKKAQMTAKHADEREALAVKHAREKESMKESSAAKIVKTKLSTMANKNVRIPSPAERRAEIEKRKQMKEDIDMLSFDEYLQEDMRIAKASSMAKKYAGNMTQAVKKIDSIRKGLSNHPKVKDALKKANEELSAKQKKLDHNKNGKIDAADLATLRSKKKNVNELDKSTLKSYADKAHQASQDHAYDAEHQYNDKKEQEYSRKMAAKRAAGAAKADAKLAKEETELDEGLLDKIAAKVTNHTMNKMAKNNPKAHAKFQKAQAAGVFNMKKEEEEELDELSKKTLGSYVKKASFNAAQSAYQAGGSNGNIAKLQPHMDKLNKRTAGVHKATDKLTKEEVETEDTLELKSYKDFMSEMDNSKRYVHKGTRYGGSAQRDTDHENDFGHDDEKEKFKRLLQKKPEKKTQPAPAVKRGRGRPAGSKSGARDYYNKK